MAKELTSTPSWYFFRQANYNLGHACLPIRTETSSAFRSLLALASLQPRATPPTENICVVVVDFTDPLQRPRTAVRRCTDRNKAAIWKHVTPSRNGLLEKYDTRWMKAERLLIAAFNKGKTWWYSTEEFPWSRTEGAGRELRAQQGGLDTCEDWRGYIACLPLRWVRAPRIYEKKSWRI